MMPADEWQLFGSTREDGLFHDEPTKAGRIPHDDAAIVGLHEAPVDEPPQDRASGVAREVGGLGELCLGDREPGRASGISPARQGGMGALGLPRMRPRRWP